jgi:hypothetical protein
VMGEPVEQRSGHLGVTEHRRMPHFSLGIYLTSRLRNLVMVFTGSVLSWLRLKRPAVAISSLLSCRTVASDQSVAIKLICRCLWWKPVSVQRRSPASTSPLCSH